jgi:nicotinamide mononucleotide transporter
MNILEVVGAITGLLCVWLAARQQVWTWPVALVNVACYFAFFYQIRLYADMWLQVFFLASNLYGWYEWLYGGKNHSELPVTRLRPLPLVGVLVSGLVISGLMGLYFQSFTNASYPLLDSALAAFSILAQVLLTRKKIENWVIWFVVDIFYVGLYYQKQAYLTSGLYFIFLILAVQGFLEWRRSLVRAAETPA